mmetsp:Transcript_11652/g.15842  ORF Transcript_11652/g.15842 Transcript_11652/m.15842 type:complete len:228 (-) Transcript_11652:102-785(-)|eukprot:CAMPEP_0196578376 /NCGR_PEP_ID=MMETSP1081-20130531/7280_1 /TAXON_ID=36882 /ORGANISM="Pyramimonas amylifera, Strain CCMP720" /LENGTH=227 /DNA_ID=CAMNT_0041897577 /DNA_START=100 /DNA_END=783 /DNA_ORIENTATION=-
MACKFYLKAYVILFLVGICLTGTFGNYDMDLEDVDVPGEALLLARKYIVESPSVASENLTIMVEIFNLGDSAAFGVKLRDDSIVLAGDTFEFVEGTADASWEKIGAGANITHKYVVKAMSTGVLQLGSASITYRPTSDSSDTKTVLSTSPVPTPLLSVFEKYFDASLIVGKYVSLGFCKTKSDWKVFGFLTVFIAFLFSSNSAAHKYKAWRRDRQYKSATEFLMKDE